MRPIREHATCNGQTYMITSSTWGAPQALKPAGLDEPYAARLEGAPFQNKTFNVRIELKKPELVNKTA